MCTKTRSIDELTALGTYQGMTDAEIASIIEFKVSHAVALARTELRAEFSDKAFAAHVAQCNELNSKALSVLEYMRENLKPLAPIREPKRVGDS